MIEDTEETLSILTAFFNVPTGKYGKLTWTGKVDTQRDDFEADRGIIMVDNDSYNMHFYHGHDDAGHYSVEPYEAYFFPGTHLISWAYQQCGDRKIFGNDRISISDLSIEIIDKLPSMEVWENLPFDMGEVYEGHLNIRTVNIANLTSTELALYQSENAPYFSLYIDEEMNSEIPSFEKGQIEIEFLPMQAGNIEDELTLQTSVGELPIPVKGISKSTENTTFIEDFENGIEHWTVIDANQDKYYWHYDNSGTYAKTGVGSILINSIFPDYVDDYIVSPEFVVPENAAELTWWRRYTKDWNNSYDLLIGEGDDPTDFESVFTDDGHSQFEFEQVKVDISQFAGKIVKMAFYNHTSDGRQSVLIIDDVAVYSNTLSCVENNVADEITSVDYWMPDGTKVMKPNKGFVIEKTTYKDGSVKSRKCFIR